MKAKAFRWLVATVVTLTVLLIAPGAFAQVVTVNFIDPPITSICANSQKVFIIGCEIVTAPSGLDMLSAFSIRFHNEKPFAVSRVNVYQILQGTGIPILRAGHNMTDLPLTNGEEYTILNVNAPFSPGTIDTILVEFDVNHDSVAAHPEEYDGTGVQFCLAEGGLTFLSAGGIFPPEEYCPIGFDPGPPPSGYRVVFNTWPKCGDVDGNGEVNVADAYYVLAYIFGLGPEPLDISGGDVDCSGRVNLADCVYLIAHIFRSGAKPCANCDLKLTKTSN